MPDSHDDGAETDFTRPAGTTRTLHSNRSFAWNPKYGTGNLVDQFYTDPLYAVREHSGNIYYPFRDEEEWELMWWLEQNGVPLQAQDSFLKLKSIGRLGLSVKSARDIRNRIEHLPQPPRWKTVTITMPGYRTKEPIVFIYRDGAECARYLFANPAFANCIETTAYTDIKPNGGRVVKEFMSAKVANRIQANLPRGETLNGIVCSSDKTPLTVGTGNKEMHPFLITLAGILGTVRMKASSQAYVIGCYIPTPKFLDVTPEEQTILTLHLFHKCAKICTNSLQQGCKVPIPMADPLGMVRNCRTPLVAYIVDNPEQLMIACAAGKQSPVTLAKAKEFGDPQQHELRTRDWTARQIAKACALAMQKGGTPDQLCLFHKICKELGINGVIDPFWLNWGTEGIHWADPCKFLMLDILHLVHKFFWDHIAKQWTIHLIGRKEFNRCLSSIQPRRGVRHWPHGMSSLKQITGAEYRELEHLIMCILAGAAKVTPQIYSPLYPMLCFIYQTQALSFNDEARQVLDRSLAGFHAGKPALLEAGVRHGKRAAIKNWQIPKLEGLLNISRSVGLVGSSFQYSADPTERIHQVGKQDYKHTNGVNFLEQCARALDRDEKLRLFTLQTTVLEHHRSATNIPERTPALSEKIDNLVLQGYLIWAWEVELGLREPERMLFESPTSWIIDAPDASPRDSSTPDHSTGLAAAELTLHPHHASVGISALSAKWCITDCLQKLRVFFGTRNIPFTTVKVWDYFRFQTRSALQPSLVTQPQVVHAQHPSTQWPHGLYTGILIAHTSGYLVAQVKCIFEPIFSHPADREYAPQHIRQPVLLVQIFQFEPYSGDDWTMLPGDPVSRLDYRRDVGMYRVKHWLDAAGKPVELLISFSAVRRVLKLVAAYRPTINPNLNSLNSFSLPDTSFHVNPFADNETYHTTFSKT
ncbi:hypothetical protein PENSPDRAFT_590010 [Peniophora sp. CONT]|nr:hypothetical protein PENSPDRAFT_590010 [Peniophora sp. CONT]